MPEAAPSLLALSPPETEAALVRLGGRPFHGRIVREKVLAKGVLDYAAMTALPRPLRRRLERELPIFTGREARRHASSDGAVKLLVELADGATVETVHIPSRRPGRGATLCVSTQVGCPVGCPFCASGLGGLTRNLAAHEILEQYVRGRELGPLARSVVMGIGEPLLNYANLSRALAVVREELGLGARRITVSTVGFPERLVRLAPERPGFQLAISLHSPDDRQRAELVPAMASVPVERVLEAGDVWFGETGREVTYEYVLLGGCNDSPGHARRLARRLAGRRANVNLIPYNPAAPGPWRRPEAEGVAAFRRTLEEAGLVATVRWSRGLEAEAACGQLRMGSGAGDGRRP